MNKIVTKKLKSNCMFSIIKGPYDKKRHQNQREGLDMMVNVIDHKTGIVNHLKLYKNSKNRLYFKKNGYHYIDEFNCNFLYVPFQMIDLTNAKEQKK